MEAIKRAVSVLGGAELAAATLGVSKASVYFWMKGKRGLPAELCPAIERATRAKAAEQGNAGLIVTCEQLCPAVDWGVLRGTAAEPQETRDAA